ALVSRYLLADIRTSQAPYIIPNHLAQADPLILRFEKWARDHLKAGFSLQDAAGALATSARTLQRRCEAVLGKSPLSYFQDLRVERAQSLLHGSGRDIESIAAEVGYVDGATLRTLLRERLGRGVRELRANLRCSWATRRSCTMQATTNLRACRDADRRAMLPILNTAAEAYRGVIPADGWHEAYMSADELDDEIAAGVTFWGHEVDGMLAGLMGMQSVLNVDLIRHA